MKHQIFFSPNQERNKKSSLDYKLAELLLQEIGVAVQSWLWERIELMAW